MSSNFVPRSEFDAVVQKYETLIFDLRKYIQSLEQQLTTKISEDKISFVPAASDILSSYPPDILYMITGNLSLKELSFLCSASSYLNSQLCSNENFWRGRYLMNFYPDEYETLKLILYRLSQQEEGEEKEEEEIEEEKIDEKVKEKFTPPADEETWRGRYRNTRALSSLIQTLQILNFMVHNYDLCYGFQYDRERLMTKLNLDPDLLSRLVDNIMIVSINDVYKVRALFVEPLFQITEEDFVVANRELMLSLAQMELPYDIIHIASDGLYPKLYNWAYYPEDFRRICNEPGKPPVEDVSKLSLWSRPYIEADSYTGHMILSKEQKGSPLTPEDILFACRGIMRMDDTIEQFICHHSDEKNLYLAVDIFSG